MKGARYYGKQDIRVEDLPEPEPAPGRVLVDVEWCGICGSDLHEYIQGPMGISTAERPHKLTGEYLPVIMGHEFCGRVKSAPPNSKYKVGQAVMCDPRLCCRACTRCESGQDHGCEKLGFLGYHGAGGGGFSEVVGVEERMLYSVPDKVPLDSVALVEPLAVAEHAVKMVGVEDFGGTDVLVLGGGPVGYAVILALRARQAKNIFVSEPASIRREQTSRLVEAVMNPMSENVGDRCRSLTGGKGVDVVFDCAGVPAGLNAGFDALDFAGLYVNVALWEKPMTLPMFPLFLKQIRLTSSCTYNDEDFAEVMEKIGQGKFEGYEDMVTSRIPLADLVADGFEQLVNKKDDHIKILVSPKPGKFK